MLQIPKESEFANAEEHQRAVCDSVYDFIVQIFDPKDSKECLIERVMLAAGEQLTLEQAESVTNAFLAGQLVSLANSLETKSHGGYLAGRVPEEDEDPTEEFMAVLNRIPSDDWLSGKSATIDLRVSEDEWVSAQSGDWIRVFSGGGFDVVRGDSLIGRIFNQITQFWTGEQ